MAPAERKRAARYSWQFNEWEASPFRREETFQVEHRSHPPRSARPGKIEIVLPEFH